ncbi:MAG TPA: AMP-dependent synthetase, partial [Fuerstia sp.]|nr:AMP-dependent synthetase [Fuerstiella sp.]
MPLNPDDISSANALPDPIWLPDPETTQRTHIAAAMQARGFASYEQLYDWSVAEPEEFWAYVLDTLCIHFDRQPLSVLDLPTGPMSPEWLPGARLNIAESCFTSKAGSCAVIEGSPDGSRRELTYARLRGLANQVARGLLAQGIQRGEAVAVFMPMTAESVAIYLGIVLAGCTVVSIA